MPLRIGTRASALAQWQANWVAERLRDAGHAVEMVLISTEGDRSQGDQVAANEGAPVGSLGTVGVFTKELQRSLLEDRIDLAVHSLKDLPTDTVEGLILAAVPAREAVMDVLVSRENLSLAELPPAAIVGTGSLRRRAQVLCVRPDLQMAEIRGNVDTRLRKLHEGQFDAIVLAEAGLTRLGLTAAITEVLPLELMLPAVGQGALGIEARADDRTTLAALQELDHAGTHAAVLAERALLSSLSGGCLAPIGAYARQLVEGDLQLSATVLATDGSRRLAASAKGDFREPVLLGQQVARQLLLAGAAELVRSARDG